MEVIIEERLTEKVKQLEQDQELPVYPVILTGTVKNLTLLKMWLDVSFFILRKYPNPIRFIKIIKRVMDLKKRYTLKEGYKKLVRVDGKIYFNLNNNGWPSSYFYRLIDVEAKETVYHNVSHLENLRLVLIAFTKKCPLFCEHCYEGPELNKKDTLSLEDHKKILRKLQQAGVSLFHFGGGDPMSKVNEMVELLESAAKTADFWIYTSGFNVSEKNAQRLKNAGLTGISISLDHYLPEYHNKFRNNEAAYDWVETAAKSALKAKLVIAFTICVTKDFCTEENLFKYLQLAKRLGASFVQLMEPRAVGNYAGKDVALHADHEKILDRFFIRANTDPNYKDLPIVLYPAYHQRKAGCPGAGSKYLYIDTDGYMSSCPFCRNKKTHILDENHEVSIKAMKSEGCGKYSNLN